MHTEFWWGILKERDCLAYMGVSGGLVLNCVLKDTGWQCVGCINLPEDRDVVGCCEHGNEPLISTK
jgi:hypothetical protein